MKKLFFTISIFLSFCTFQNVFASEFPNDAKTIFSDQHSGSSGTLLASSGSDRTIYYAAIDCDFARDNHIRVGSSGNNYIVDTENQISVQRQMSYKLTSGNSLQWVKNTSGDHCNFTVVYTDYDNATIPNVITPDLTNLQNQFNSANQQILISNQKLDLLSDNQKMTTGYIFMIIVFVGVWVVGRFIFKLIQDTVLGW